MPTADEREGREPLPPGYGPQDKPEGEQAEQVELRKTLDGLARKIHGIKEEK